jgi:hypothetical protein
MPKKEFISECRLCLNRKPLVNSHIIPNFQFKPLKKQEGFFYHLSTDENQPERKEQKGITERLFCVECDTVRLQKNEDHLAKVLFGGYPLVGNSIGRLHIVEGFDYCKIKNGLLSILWRMSICSHPFFKGVELGNKHEERIRNAIWNNELLLESDYPILVAAPVFQNELLDALILEPDFTRLNGNRVYRCFISGLLFTFFIGSTEVGKQTQHLAIKANGSWAIMRAKVEEIPFLFDACVQFSKAQKLRTVA